jgi:hypothetical protein
VSLATLPHVPEPTESPGLAMVLERIDKALPKFNSGRDYYRRGSLLQTVLTATLGALTTFLIGADAVFQQNWLTALSLATAAATTVAGAWNAWFGFKPLWINNQNTVNSLYELRDRITLDRALAGGAAAGEQAVRAYFEQYQQILHRANAEWTRIRLSKE